MGNILPDLSKPSYDEIMAKLIASQAEIDRLKASKVRTCSLKVTEKGGLSVYGLGRFPVTLYRQQWERLLDQAVTIREFINTHQGELSVKE